MAPTLALARQVRAGLAGVMLCVANRAEAAQTLRPFRWSTGAQIGLGRACGLCSRLSAASPYGATKNLAVVPHISCDDPRYIEHLHDFWFSHFERFLAGKKLRNIVNRNLGY